MVVHGPDGRQDAILAGRAGRPPVGVGRDVVATGSEAQFYTGLVAELYGPLRSEIPDPEPYARFIARSGEPALELGCGGGDPMLDLVERGIDVDGVDSSADMLERCRAAAAERGLSVAVHHQAMQDLRLDRRYRSIFLAGPTFNLLADDDAAGAALAAIARHLDPSGSVLIPLMVPEPTAADMFGVARDHVASDGTTMRVAAIAQDHDVDQRTQTTTLRYQRLRDGEVTRAGRAAVGAALAHQDSFRRLADDAGLDVVTVIRPDGTPADVEESTHGDDPGAGRTRLSLAGGTARPQVERQSWNGLSSLHADHRPVPAARACEAADRNCSTWATLGG